MYTMLITQTRGLEAPRTEKPLHLLGSAPVGIAPFPGCAWLAGTLALSLLAGCSAPVERPTEPPAPPSWQRLAAAERSGAGAATLAGCAAAGEASAMPLWSDLQDVALLKLQAEVLQANLDLRQAALRMQSSALALGLQDLRLQPNLSASYGGSKPLRSSGPSTVSVGGQQIPVPRNDRWSANYAVNTGVSWEFDLWGRISADREARKAQHEALRADEQAARQALLSRTAELWWQLGALSEQLPLLQMQVAHAEQALPMVRARVQEGKLLPAELDRSSRRLLDSRNRLADVQAERQQRTQELAVLLAEPDSARVAAWAAQARLPQWPSQAWTERAQTCPAQVLERRPDVQRARLQVDSALATVRGAQAARYPSLTLSTSLSSSAQTLGKLVDQPRFSLSSGLVVPLIDWRRLELQEARTRTELELAAVQLRDAFNKALSDVEVRWIEAERLARQRDAQDAALREAQAADAQARARLDAGALSRADWLQTQDALLLARQQLLQVRLNSWLNQSAFVKALGGAGGS
jgi:outer membrane protein TolC